VGGIGKGASHERGPTTHIKVNFYFSNGRGAHFPMRGDLMSECVGVCWPHSKVGRGRSRRGAPHEEGRGMHSPRGVQIPRRI
jgi:hypothetical protein